MSVKLEIEPDFILAKEEMQHYNLIVKPGSPDSNGKFHALHIVSDDEHLDHPTELSISLNAKDARTLAEFILTQIINE